MCKAAKQAGRISILFSAIIAVFFSSIFVRVALAAKDTTDVVTGRNAWDVLVAGRDLAILAVILIAYFCSTWKLVSRFATAIDNNTAALNSASVTNATNVHNIILAWREERAAFERRYNSMPCFAEELVKDAMRGTLVTALRNELQKQAADTKPQDSKTEAA